MKKIIFVLSIVFFSSAISFQSCSSCNNKRKKDQKDSAFEKGKVISKVVCKKDITQSYALYLPSSYSEDKKWPVVYAFDSHGKGLLPVELFKDEAERYGYIIVGSNNSKNGTPLNVTSEIYDTLYNDTHRRLSIDDNRIYTAGFSGGSRVASTLAITKGGIISVIGCGAGIGTQEQPRQKFGYFGIAGNEDMNLNEMIVLDSSLEKSGYRHYLEVFNGKHEWPPKSVVSDAFLWLELNAYREKQITINDTLAKNIFNLWNNEYKSLSEKKRAYEAYLLCKKIINYFDGITDVSSLKKDLSKLKASPAVVIIIKHLNEIAKRETELQSYFLNAMNTQTAEWWRIQVGIINKKLISTQDDEEKFMYKRVFNYLSLAAYMNASSNLKAGQYDNAAKYNIIYSLVDPENPEHSYISATLSMKKGSTSEAIIFLEEAAKSGFAEPERFDNDSVMSSLKQNEKYSEILESFKNNVKIQQLKSQ